MKLEDLKEAPQYVDKELDKKFETSVVFASDDALKSDYDELLKIHDPNGDEDLEAYIRKSKSAAIIGHREVRQSDGKHGLRPYTRVEFKKTPNLDGIRYISSNDDVLQVSIVTTSEQNRKLGFGMLLYLALAKNGFTIVSDNTQYVGGKELWKSIASKVVGSRYKIFVLENGDLMMDGDEPVVYDGSNIDDALLWSENSDKKYTLFALKKT